MHARSGMGGAGLVAGETIALADACEGPTAPHPLGSIREAGEAGPIRIVPGPQNDYFDHENFEAFLRGPWRVSLRSDRMAYAMEGPKIGHAKGSTSSRTASPSARSRFPATASPSSRWPIVRRPAVIRRSAR